MGGLWLLEYRPAEPRSGRALSPLEWSFQCLRDTAVTGRIFISIRRDRFSAYDLPARMRHAEAV